VFITWLSNFRRQSRLNKRLPALTRAADRRRGTPAAEKSAKKFVVCLFTIKKG